MKFWKVFIGIVLTSVLSLNANDFKVLSKSGNVMVQSGKKWNSIKVGATLRKSDKIKTESKSHVVLIFLKNKRAMEITVPGTFDLSKIAEDLNKKGSINAKIAKYFVDELSDTDEFFKKNNYKEGMEGNLAAVDRGIGFSNATDTKVAEITQMQSSDSKLVSNIAGTILGTDTKMIFTKFPKSSYILEPVTKFEWYRFDNSTEYTMKISDESGKEIFKNRVTDTAITIDLRKLKLTRGINYYWQVEANSCKSMEECFVLLNEEKVNEIESVVSEISAESDKNSPMYNIAIAHYLADCNVSTSAYSYFVAAMVQAPDCEEYKKAFARFLIRIGNYEEARSIFAK